MLLNIYNYVLRTMLLNIYNYVLLTMLLNIYNYVLRTMLLNMIYMYVLRINASEYDIFLRMYNVIGKGQ